MFRIFKALSVPYSGRYAIEYTDNCSTWTTASARRCWRLRLTCARGGESWRYALELHEVAPGDTLVMRDDGRFGIGEPRAKLEARGKRNAAARQMRS